MFVTPVENGDAFNRIERRRFEHGSWFAALVTVVAGPIVQALGSLRYRGRRVNFRWCGPGIVHLSDIRTRGAAWGMLAGHRWFLVLVALGVMLVVGYLAREIAPRSAWACAGLGLILGGAIGNLIDRVLFGSVTDFIDMDTTIQWIREFPVFNLADSALTVGVALLLIEIFSF